MLSIKKYIKRKGELLIMRETYLDELPKWEMGGQGTVGTTKWIKSSGLSFGFQYDDIKGTLKIISYEPIKQDLMIQYLDNKPYKINIHSIKECMLGKLLGVITTNFKVEIGAIFKNDVYDYIIIDRKITRKIDKKGHQENRKWYKYHCNKCGYDEGWVLESNLIKPKGQNCSCCAGWTVIKDINDIKTTAPWMIPYFLNYEDSKLYVKNSGQKIKVICPDCNRIRDREIKVSDIYRTHSIGCSCGDKIPYSEKIMYSVLEQLHIDCITQLNKATFKWCNKFRYDFYVVITKNIIETHGIQHYVQTGRKGARSLEFEIENDAVKKELALKNGIKEDDYIVIDCRWSEIEFIKNNIIDSELNNIFDLSKINWNKCEEYALKNLCKVACEMKRDNPNITCSKIGKSMNMTSQTIIKYLKRGSKIWEWCNYDPKEEMRRSGVRTSKSNIGRVRHGVEIFKNNISLGIFESIGYLANKSESLFGIKLSRSGITRVCNGYLKENKGFSFKRIEEYNINLLRYPPQLYLPLPKQITQTLPIIPIPTELAITL